MDTNPPVRRMYVEGGFVRYKQIKQVRLVKNTEMLPIAFTYCPICDIL